MAGRDPDTLAALIEANNDVIDLCREIRRLRTGDTQRKAIAERRPWISECGHLYFWNPEVIADGIGWQWSRIRPHRWKHNRALAEQVEAIKNGQEWRKEP